MAPVGVDRDVDRIQAGLLQLKDKFALFLGIEAEVGVDGEDQEAVASLLAAGEKLAIASGITFPGGIVARPHVDNAQVGIGIEALHELLALVEHVALELVADLVP